MSKSWKATNVNRNVRSNDSSSCRGHPVIMCTCDTARERESNKELVTLLTQAIDELYPQSKENEEDQEQAPGYQSIQQLLAEEVKKVKSQSHRSTQSVMTINTDMRGIVLAKIMIKDACPIKLINFIFDRVKTTKRQCCKNLVRFIPLQYVFYPSEEELLENFYKAIQIEFPGVIHPKVEKIIRENKQIRNKSVMDDVVNPNIENTQDINQSNEEDEHIVKKTKIDSNTEVEVPINLEIITHTIVPDNNEISKIESAIYPSFTWQVTFKARNHDVLKKTTVQSIAYMCIPNFGKVDFLKPQVCKNYLTEYLYAL